MHRSELQAHRAVAELRPDALLDHPLRLRVVERQDEVSGGFEFPDREALLADHLADLQVLELGQDRLRARDVIVIEQVIRVPPGAVVADLNDPRPDGWGWRGD